MQEDRDGGSAVRYQRIKCISLQLHPELPNTPVCLPELVHAGKPVPDGPMTVRQLLEEHRPYKE